MPDTLISLDTNILIDDPKIVFDKSRNFVLSFTVIRELDKLKRNPDLKRAAQAAIVSIWFMFKQNKLKILNVPNLLGDSPDEKIIQDTKDANASILSNDIAVRIIAHAHGIDISDFEVESGIDEDYTGYIEIEGGEDYEKHFIQLKELQPEEFEETFGHRLRHNQYAIINRIGSKNDIWVAQTLYEGEEERQVVSRISQSLIPFRNAGILREPLDDIQKCALHAVFNNDVPLTVIDGKLGTGKTMLSVMGALACTVGQKQHRHYGEILVTKSPESINIKRYTGFKPGPQPLWANILTPTGWVEMRDIRTGDEVIGRDGKPKTVIGVFPKGKREVFKISTNTGKEVFACGDHLWATQNHNEFKHNKQSVIRTTTEIAETLHYKNTGKLNHHLPRIEPIMFDAEEMPLDPYVLGCLLGDGSIGVKSTPSIASVDKEIISEINERLLSIGAGVLGCNGIEYSLGAIDGRSNKPKGPNSTGRFTNPVKQVLSDLDLLGKHFDTKFIPDIFLYRSSIEDRLELLQGLMDTDGSVNKDGKAVFYSSGEPLVNSIISLVRSLGGSTSLYTRDRESTSTIDGREVRSTCASHEVSITLPSGMMPFKLSRKVENVLSRKSTKRAINTTSDIISSVEPYSFEEVQCISIDGDEHLYITNDFIPTHNTSEEKLGGHLGGFKSNLKFLVNKKKKVDLKPGETAPPTEADEIWDRHFKIVEIDEMQGDSVHDNILLVDEWQLLDEDGALLVMSRIAAGSKVVLIGDTTGQTYGLNRANEGFKILYQELGNAPEFSYIKLKHIYRSRLAEFVARLYERY